MEVAPNGYSIVRSGLPRIIALVGQPNVGKSALMNALTGAHAFVSNYPGTTVEVTEGTMLLGGRRVRVIDTPGTYSLHSDTEDQRVSQRVLLEADVDLIVNIVDATNLARNLYLTLQLLDLGIPMVIALNQVDRARAMGIEIDAAQLERQLGVPVVPIVATTGEGIPELVRGFTRAKSGRPMTFSENIEAVLSNLENEIRRFVPEIGGKRRHHTTRALAVHLMEHDELDEDLFQIYPQLRTLVEEYQHRAGQGTVCSRCYRACAFCPARDERHPAFPTCLERTAHAREIAARVSRPSEGAAARTRRNAEDVLDIPAVSLLVTAVIVYSSYRLVAFVMGLFETLMDAMTGPLMEWLSGVAAGFPAGSFPATFLEALPEGLVLPFSVVFPAMLTIYLLMGFLEDTGLLARMAVTLHRFTSLMGLPGQAVVPLVLGFGCRAPAVLASRGLPDRRSRLICLALLAMTVPCAASLAIITGVSSVSGASLPVIYGTVAITFFLAGVLAGRFLPGESAGDFVMEVPPLRRPLPSNIWRKSWVRMKGFFSHVLPLLTGVSVAVRYLVAAGYLDFLTGLGPLSYRFLGVRGEVFAALAVTVVQRYLAPMVLLNLPLAPREATIALSMVSLSMPCTPVLVLLVKEAGWRSAFLIAALALGVSLGAGVFLNLVLP